MARTQLLSSFLRHSLATLLLAICCALPLSAQSTFSKPELVLQTGHAKPVTALAISPNGRWLVSASADNTIKLWDLASGSVLRTLTGHAGSVLCVAVSPDNQWIASGSEDATVKLWNVTTGGDPRALSGHLKPVREVAFSADSRQLTSLGIDAVKLWDTSGGREIRATKFNEQFSDQAVAALSRDGRLAAIGGGYSLKGPSLANSLPGVAIFRGGGVSQQPIKIIEVASGRELTSEKIKGKLTSLRDLTFSPDGRLVAAQNIAFDKRDNSEGSVTIFETASGRDVQTFQIGQSLGASLAFSFDGQFLASRQMTSQQELKGDATDLTKLGVIRIYETATWRVAREIKGSGIEFSLNQSAPPLGFSPDGKLLAASYSTGIALYDTASGARMQVLRTSRKESALSQAPPNRDEMMRQAGVDPDGLRAMQEMIPNITGMMDSIGMGGAGKAMKVISGSQINFSADGKLLSATPLMGGFNTISWDVVSGTPRQPTVQRGENETTTISPLTAPVFSPDGKLQAALAIDLTAIIVSEPASQREVQRIPLGGQTASVQLAFGPRWLAVQYLEIKQPSRASILGGGKMPEPQIKLFDPRTGRVLREVKTEGASGGFGFGFGNLSVFSPDARYLIALNTDSGGIGGGLKPSLPSLGGIGIGRRGGGKPQELPKQKYKLKLTELETGRKVWEVNAEGENLMSPPSFNFSQNGSLLAVTSYEKNQPVIALYDTASGRKFAAVTPSGQINTMNFSPDGKLLVTSTGNIVMLWDAATGRQTRTLTHATAVNGAAISPNLKVVATLEQDSNQHLWDAQTGEKLATLVNLEALRDYSSSAQEWLVVTPEGLFDGSPAAWQQIMWRFSSNTFDVGPVELFFNDFYYPGLLAEIFTGRRPKPARALQQIDRRQPTVKLALGQRLAGPSDPRRATVKVEIVPAPSDQTHPQDSGARDVRLFRNGSLVQVWRGDVLQNASKITFTANVPLVAGTNRFTAYGFNRDNVKSSDASLIVTGDQSLARKGTLYLLAVGVNQYANSQFNLRYAVPDVQAVSAELQKQQAKLDQFQRVVIVPLLDAEATKANVLAALARLAGETKPPPTAPVALQQLQRSEPEDAVIIYFAGHGLAAQNQFYLIPHDLGYDGARESLDEASIKNVLAHGISDRELETAFETIDARHLLLVIDACQSGQALESEEKRRGPMNAKGLAQLAYEKGMYILAGAQAYQAALEAAQLGHGYLTYALVEEALKTEAAVKNGKEKEVTVQRWLDYAAERVPQMQQEKLNNARELKQKPPAFAPGEEKVADPAERSVQRPRVFYRREVDEVPLIVAKPAAR
ncbi:MAG: caspase family protein [Acidobacteriota bacterium]